MGPESIRISKVKGHATESQVEDGTVKAEHKEGNDRSDDAATIGIRSQSQGILETSNWLIKSHAAYTKFIHRVQCTIVAVLKAEQTQIKEATHAAHVTGQRKAALTDTMVD